MSGSILIIDDSAAQRKLVRLALETQGYVVVEAEDGMQAMEAMDRIGGSTRLILCDVNMPVMNGLEFVRELKKRENHAAIPVIMLTTETNETMVEEMQSLGTNSWLTKPFKMSDLITETRRHIRF
ncbi:response regulator [Leptonema illini]|uniref:Response regulator receiver protein n=1 Tax=Leptonema illini DSM 21528 TaxID=929563 RepID=H2CGY4_9LEPT|nr:response regulator [Leptonema illini]EHQ05826.1 response regulator receiver protein [Leptonema illini DSM 21528]